MTLPIIEQLRDMRRDADRADWLQRVPFDVLINHGADIAAALQSVQFHAGLRCLETERVLLASTRAEDGGFRQVPLLAANAMRGAMRDAVKRGAA